jgi:predicted ABC-type ATPase
LSRPAIWVIAGPNGSGKSTYWREQGAALIEAAFINADDLARERFGHPARTEDQSRWGQAEAERRRRALMEAGTGFVMESTFSHRSKLDLLWEGRRLGFAIHVIHLHLDSADLAVERVRIRVIDGGHPVPEDRIRARFARNQPLIREAVRGADLAWVLDASPEGAPPVLMLRFADGQVVERHPSPAAWVRRLYL